MEQGQEASKRHNENACNFRSTEKKEEYGVDPSLFSRQPALHAWGGREIASGPNDFILVFWLVDWVGE